LNLAHHFKLVSWAAASKIPPVIYGFVFLFVLMTSLSPSEHGQYATVYYFFTIITLLVKFLIFHPMIHFASAPGRFERVTRIGFQLSGLFYILFGLIIWFSAPVISEMWRIPVNLVRIAPLLMAAIFFRELGYCIQQTRFNTKNLFIIESVYFLGSASGFVVLASMGKLTTAYSALAVHLYAAIASTMVVLITGFRGTKLFGRIYLSEIKELLQYGWTTLGIGFSGFIMSAGADVLLFGAIFTQKEVGFYNGAKHAYRMLSNISQAVALVIMPYASQLIAQKRFSELKATYEKVIGYIVAIALTICSVGWLIAGWVYGSLFKGEYVESTPILRLLLVGATFEAIYTISANILYGAGYAGSVAMISLITVAIWLVVSIPGIYFWGGMGAALGLTVAMIFAGIMQHKIAAERFDTNFENIAGRLGRNISSIFKILKSRNH
jgi:O-antigen/teichoic acid export membrane protein